MIRKYRYLLAGAASLLVLTAAFAPGRQSQPSGGAVALTATLSEWKIDLSSATIAAGQVTFTATNAGSIPHALEVEGNGLEQKTPLIQPGQTTMLTLTLKPGSYEIYCPVGDDSHKKLGMETHLKVEGEKGAVSKYGSVEIEQPTSQALKVQAIQVSGGGPVVQILPGPFPFPDSVAPVLPAFGDERAMLEKQESNGPYSNNVATTSGKFSFTALDLGATRDSIDGLAEFATEDGARWKLVLDRVQTKDMPHHPRFGGVIMGLYYHGMTTVHTPLVPTINSAVALWSIGHLYRNGTLVTDNAQVHVMLLSSTRRPGDFALNCWDCSKNKIEELQLQITPAKDDPPFDAPGGFLFLNWEKSRGQQLTPPKR
jgi:plastocyanin